ncbi:MULTISPECIES: TonB-dependent receptor plug domain-containing protein [unclassified Pseudoalteromonas]|uniref:TonB-dependent receptor plug domain-containing protein n=1 Tax=unclassified Pseudoalteromonas TaxID=194690 RepID=UPI0003F59313|nr:MULTISPECIES: TonB-dependent receptor [unclassified Pseudoalteromonas]MBH0089689.1 TonB-dependent receptor [Pseudoalteromonas sp. NSLLW218]
MLNNKISKAVRLAIAFSAVSTATFSASSIAAEKEKVERIEVTGSRIKQVDMETSSPVTVITAADLQLSGEASVADVLNNTSVNSFGSWRGMSGYGNGAAATSNINMRGLGAEYTLVLLDGRRMPGTSSSSGAAADTSRIPMAIVERIEILREGASAVYGSDAVAGVINIITKKDFNGLSFSYDTELPSAEGGDTNRFNVSTGYSGEKGNITLTYEYYDAESVYDRDIWKLNDETYADYSSFSSVPNGNGASGWVTSPTMCAESNNTVDGGTRCLYNYGAVTKLFGDTTQNSMLSNFNYEFTDNLKFRGRASASLSETDSRYAGTPVSTNQPTMLADNPLNPVGEDLTLYMRSANIGERDTRTEINSIDFLGGLVGFVDVANGIDWEFNVQHSRSTTNSFNTNLINDDVVQKLIDSGEYDIFNTSGMSFANWDSSMKDLYGQAAHTGVYQARFTSTQFDTVASTLLFDNGDVSIAGVVGAEFEQVEFEQMSDPQSASGRVSGGSGGDDVNAERDRTSVYSELQVNLPYNVDIKAAVRYDKYEQEGDVGSQFVSGTFDNVAPQIGVAWRPSDALLVRASWGESFRAPNMGEMFSSQALSFEKAYDTIWCDTQGNAGSDAIYCNPNASQQHKTWFGGNPDLEPEEGESFTTGFVWNVTDDLSVELSYYNIKLENRIAAVSVERLLKDEQDNGSNPAVVRDPNTGRIDVMYSFDQNMASLETSGFDFKTAYMFESSIGNFALKGELSYVSDFEEVTEEGADAFDYAGLQEYPELRGNVTFDWTNDAFGAAWTTYYIGDQDSGNEEYGVTYLADIPSYIKHNIQVSYNHEWNGKFVLGVNNVFDKEAPQLNDGTRGYRDASTSLYDVLGRAVFLKVEQNF